MLHTYTTAKNRAIGAESLTIHNAVSLDRTTNIINFCDNHRSTIGTSTDGVLLHVLHCTMPYVDDCCLSMHMLFICASMIQTKCVNRFYCWCREHFPAVWRGRWLIMCVFHYLHWTCDKIVQIGHRRRMSQRFSGFRMEEIKRRLSFLYF